MRIFLADPQRKVRSALRLLLEQETQWSVSGEAANAAELFTALDTATADVIVLDWSLPGCPEPELVAQVRQRWPRSAMLVLSGRPEAAAQVRAAGADAFVSKGDPPDVLLATLKKLISELET